MCCGVELWPKSALLGVLRHLYDAFRGGITSVGPKFELGISVFNFGDGVAKGRE